MITDEMNIDVLDQADCRKINETIDEIKTVYNNAASEVYYKTGQIIIDKLFGSTNLAHEFIKTKPDKTKNCLFIELHDEIQRRVRQGEADLPKKTWLYNSVRLVLAREQAYKAGLREFYNQLTISHKIALLPVSIEKLRYYLGVIVSESLSVRDTRLLIGSETKKRGTGILGYISHPERIDDIEKIPLLSGEKADKAIEHAQEKIKKMKSNLAKLEALLARQQKHRKEAL